MDHRSIGPASLSIGMGILVVAIVALILANVQTSSYTSTTTNATFYNETSVAVEGGITAYLVYNDTTRNDQLPTTNYTFSTTNGTVLILDNTIKNEAGPREIVWTRDAYTNATSVLSKGTIAIESLADWFNIIVVVVAAVIILGLVFLMGSRIGQSE